jgi:hypothetical protein
MELPIVHNTLCLEYSASKCAYKATLREEHAAGGIMGYFGLEDENQGGDSQFFF